MRQILTGTPLALLVLLGAGCPTHVDELEGPPPVEDDDAAGVPDHDDDAEDDDAGDDDTHPPGTPWCRTVIQYLEDPELVVVEADMDQGTWSELGRFELPGVANGFHIKGLAQLGDSLVMSAYTGDGFRWLEIDLAAGTAQLGPENTDRWISATEDRLVTISLSASSFEFFDDFEQLCSGAPSSQVITSAHASRHGIAGDESYTAWHSTDEIDVHDLHNGTYLRTVYPEGYDGWVNGIALAGGELFLTEANGSIRRFDAETGALRGTVDAPAVQMWHGGLWCGLY